MPIGDFHYCLQSRIRVVTVNGDAKQEMDHMCCLLLKKTRQVLVFYDRLSFQTRSPHGHQRCAILTVGVHSSAFFHF